MKTNSFSFPEDMTMEVVAYLRAGLLVPTVSNELRKLMEEWCDKEERIAKRPPRDPAAFPKWGESPAHPPAMWNPFEEDFQRNGSLPRFVIVSARSIEEAAECSAVPKVGDEWPGQGVFVEEVHGPRAMDNHAKYSFHFKLRDERPCGVSESAISEELVSSL